MTVRGSREGTGRPLLRRYFLEKAAALTCDPVPILDARLEAPLQRQEATGPGSGSQQTVKHMLTLG